MSYTGTAISLKAKLLGAFALAAATVGGYLALSSDNETEAAAPVEATETVATPAPTAEEIAYAETTSVGDHGNLWNAVAHKYSLDNDGDILRQTDATAAVMVREGIIKDPDVVQADTRIPDVPAVNTEYKVEFGWSKDDVKVPSTFKM